MEFEKSSFSQALVAIFLSLKDVTLSAQQRSCTGLHVQPVKFPASV